MNRKILATLVVVLAVAGVAGYIFYAPARANLRIIDPPPVPYSASIQAIFVTFTKVEVHAANAGNESGWHTIASNATINLLTVLNVSKTIGNGQLPPGRYTELRLFVSEATVTLLKVYVSVNVTFSIPSGVQTGIKIVIAGGGFQVYGGQSTNIQLDFAFRNSEIITNPTGSLSPVVSATIV